VSRQAIAAVVLVALLLVAGCARTAPPGGTPTDGATAAGAPLAPGEYPEGFSADGVDRDTARTRTVAFLSNASVVLDARERFRAGAYADYHFEANATHARFRMDVHNGEADVTKRDVYANATTTYRRRVHDGFARFGRSNASVAAARDEAAPLTWAVISRMLTFGDYRAVGAEEVDGRTRIRYDLTGVSLEGARDVRGHLVVDGGGVVREGFVSYIRGGERKRFEYVVRRGSDVAVRAPGWLDAARGDREDDGTARLVPA
jgi:hypothetical protein